MNAVAYINLVRTVSITLREAFQLRIRNLEGLPSRFTVTVYLYGLPPGFMSKVYIQLLPPGFISKVYIELLPPWFISKVYIQLYLHGFT